MWPEVYIREVKSVSRSHTVQVKQSLQRREWLTYLHLVSCKHWSWQALKLFAPPGVPAWSCLSPGLAARRQQAPSREFQVRSAHSSFAWRDARPECC
eukprot:7378174-Prymnesium_polylepis.4